LVDWLIEFVASQRLDPLLALPRISEKRIRCGNHEESSLENTPYHNHIADYPDIQQYTRVFSDSQPKKKRQSDFLYCRLSLRIPTGSRLCR